MILALVLRTEALRNLDPSRENVLRLEQALQKNKQALAAANREILILKDELQAQKSLVRRLMAESGKPLPPNDVIVLDQGDYDRLRNASAVADEQQKQMKGLMEQIAALKGGGSVTRPFCTTNSGYLLNVRLNNDGSISSARSWPTMADGEVAKIDGIGTLASGASMSRSAFNSAAGRVDRWARSRPVPCAFRVRVSSTHGNLNLYLQQLSAVEQHFYVLRAR